MVLLLFLCCFLSWLISSKSSSNEPFWLNSSKPTQNFIRRIRIRINDTNMPRDKNTTSFPTTILLLDEIIFSTSFVNYSEGNEKIFRIFHFRNYYTLFPITHFSKFPRFMYLPRVFYFIKERKVITLTYEKHLGFTKYESR